MYVCSYYRTFFCVNDKKTIIFCKNRERTLFHKPCKSYISLGEVGELVSSCKNFKLLVFQGLLIHWELKPEGHTFRDQTVNLPVSITVTRRKLYSLSETGIRCCTDNFLALVACGSYGRRQRLCKLSLLSLQAVVKI